MLDSLFRLIDQMDSFKRVALLFLTGLTCLTIWLGYKVIEHLDVYYQWASVPRIIKSELPCNLVQIRDKVYLVSIRFPNPRREITQITAFTSSLWVSADDSEQVPFSDYCRELVTAVNSNTAETLLKPYTENDQNTQPSN